MRRPTCLDITAHIDRRYGGVTATVPAMGLALRGQGRYESQLAAFCGTDEKVSPELIEALQVGLFPLSRFAWVRNGSAKKRLSESIRNAAAVHVHGIWDVHCGLGCRQAHAARKPLIVSAHGMLDPWALRSKRWKKKIYWLLKERISLSKATCLRALTKAEAGQYRRMGLRQPVAIIPNGISLPDRGHRESLFLQYPYLRDRKIVLFLGRLATKKGLQILTSAWATLHRDFPEAHLVLAGPDADGTEGELLRMVEEQGLASRTTFTGMLDGELKWSALQAAHVFVLPSFSEGFSVAALEALGCGTPCILSRACYFPEVEAAGAGWEVDPDCRSLVGALRNSLEQCPSERASMSEKAAALVQSRFRWEVVGAQLTETLDWLLGGTLPRTVEIMS